MKGKSHYKNQEMKRKITVTTGTRAEYGILRPVLHAILKSKKLDSIVEELSDVYHIL